MNFPSSIPKMEMITLLNVLFKYAPILSEI